MAHEKLVKEGEDAIKKGIKPAEVEDYFKKKGMDKKEAKEEITKLEASRLVEEAKKAEAAKKSAAAGQAGKTTAPEKKSSFWFWLIILLVIGVVVYLFYTGYISTDIFKNMNFKLPSFSK